MITLSKRKSRFRLLVSLIIILLVCPQLRSQITADAGGPYALDADGSIALQGMAEVNGDKLRQVVLAAQNFASAYIRLPAAYLTDPSGTPLLSWRVILLPFLGELELYNQFDRTKAWDDPVNLPLLDQMPEVYRRLGAAPDDVNTAFTGAFRTFVSGSGQNAMFEGGPDAGFETSGAGTTRFRDVTDGSSNTLYLGEVAGTDIPWTAPFDVDLNTSSMLDDPAGFSGAADNAILFSLLDGRIKFLLANTPQNIVDGLFTRDGREDSEDFPLYLLDPGTIDDSSFAWDLDDDGTFEFVGPTPTISGSDLLVGVNNVSLRVTTTTGVAITVSSTVTVNAVSNDEDGDGVLDEADFCPGTDIPEATVPVIRLKPRRFALLDGDDQFEGQAFGFTFDLEDTGGCSCEQIIDELQLSNNNRRFGCRFFPMAVWATYVYFNSPVPKSLDGSEKPAGNDWAEFLSVEDNVLGANYPNPANQVTVVPFSILEEGTTRLEVYDALGRLVAIPLAGERLPAGNYEVEVDASRLTAGTYYYRLSSGDFTAVKPMQVVH